MSKYLPLWQYVSNNVEVTPDTSLLLTFAEIKAILNFEIDHSFLTYKKELLAFGCKVDKVSLKNKTIKFVKV